MVSGIFLFSFFFQAEDGIRDLYVTGVQTCALPISDEDVGAGLGEALDELLGSVDAHGSMVDPRIEDDVCDVFELMQPLPAEEIGRASCRERVYIVVCVLT